MFTQDFRYALRTMRRSPGFSLTAILTLALGIGANTTIFSVVDAVLLRTLPYKDPDHLAILWTDKLRQGIHEAGTSYANYADWKAQSRTFEDLSICTRGNPVTLYGAEEPERVEAERVSANFFSVFGVSPQLGRGFLAEDEARGNRVVVISSGLWRRWFGGSPEVIGKTLMIDGRASVVIGVMPESFKFPTRLTQLWQPMASFANWNSMRADRDSHIGRVIGRLRPGSTFEQARAEMNAIARGLERQYPEMEASRVGFGVNVVPLDIQITGRTMRTALWVLFGAVVLVLLIACSNVANLLLARGVTRQRELALRTALGASRGQLIQQLLIESTALALVAGVLGAVLAAFGTWGLTILAPQNIPRLEEIHVNIAALMFTMAISVISGIIFGAMPALAMSRSDPNGALKDGGRSSTGLGGRRARSLLVVSEFALAIVLLSGAGLLIRSLVLIQKVDFGFRPDHMLLMRMRARAPKAGEVPAYYQQVLQRVGAIPGVRSAGVISDAFIDGNADDLITIEGRPSLPGQAAEQLWDDTISSNYFQVIGVPLIQGRFFGDQDTRNVPPVAIVNKTMTKHFWPGESAVGKRFRLGDQNSKEPWIIVVGVVEDMRRQGPDKQAISQVFLPVTQNPVARMNLVVRTEQEPAKVSADVRAAVRSFDRSVPIFDVTTGELRVKEFTAQRRFQTFLLGLFSAIALVLAAIGIYGLIHHSVMQRTQEIGVRMALGAGMKDVLRMVIGQALGLALVGIGAGLAGSLILTRMLASLLFGIGAGDPLTLVSVSVLMALVAVAASYIPAWRAARLDPLLALKYE